MKLLLTSIHIEESPRAVPLGPAMLASALKKEFSAELQIEVLNFYLNQSPAECAELILKQTPDCIGLSMYIWNRNLILEIAAILKDTNPDIIVFAGGPEASADYDGILANSAIDFVLPGEGEALIVKAFTQLLSGTDPKTIIETALPIEDLSALPSPFLDRTLNPSDYAGILWELSRGCPFKCDFCYESRGTAGVRRFPMDRIRAELRLFEQSQVEQVFVLDPTFNYNRDSAKEILQIIIQEAPKIYFLFEVRSEFIDQELAELFASIHCSLQIGLQSAHDNVLKNINRNIDRDDFEKKMLLLHEAGVTYGFDLIYGLPGDSLEGFCESIDFAMSLVPNHMDIFPLAVLPGTRLHDTAPALNLKHQADNPYLVTSSPSFSSSDIEKADEMAHAFDLFYNQGRAVPWFGMMIEALETTPSAFIGRFAEWLKRNPDGDIMDQQKTFAAALFEEQGKNALNFVLADIITYFGCADGPEEDNICNLLNHDPADFMGYLDSGITNLEDLASILK